MDYKKIILTSFLIVLLGLTGCQWPFSAKAKVDSYINSVEPISNENREYVDGLGDKISISEFSQEKMKSGRQTMEEVISEVEANKEETLKINPPREAQELQSKLESYYSTQLDALNQVEGLFSYLENAMPYWNKLSDYSNQLSEASSSNLNRISSSASTMRDQVQNDIKKLEKVETNDLTKDIHSEILTTYRGLNSLLADLIKGVNNQNPNMIASASSQYEELTSEVSSNLSNLNLAQGLDSLQNDFESSEDEVVSELNSLKAEYELTGE